MFLKCKATYVIPNVTCCLFIKVTVEISMCLQIASNSCSGTAHAEKAEVMWEGSQLLLSALCI